MKFKRDPKYFGSVALDYWPPQDWLRFRFKKYGNHEFQATVGPVRIDFSRN